jgi:hypothetical protein
MGRTGLLALLLLVTAHVAFSQQPTNDKAGSLRSRIPQANLEKYRSVRDASDWKNPYLIVELDGVEVRADGALAGGLTMPVADVIGYLERLPKGAWPYGLAVAVQENGVRGGKGTDSRIKHNRLELLRRLREARVRAELWPSG